MSISFSGLASGLDTAGWVEALVSVKQEKISALKVDLQGIKTTKSTLNDTRAAFNSLRTALEKLTDAKFGGNFDLFSQNTAKSSNEDIFTATVKPGAARQSYDVVVQQLATFTKATSLNSASAVADDNTILSQLGITEGSLTVYVDGVKTAVNIEKDDTLGELKSQLAAAGIKAEVDESGVLNLTAYNEGETINVGATTDTTNFSSLIGLKKNEDGSYASTNSLFKATTATLLTSENSGFGEQIKAGTFTIGNATFTIDEKTTLSSLISQINNSDEAQATAYWDDATGKLSITSTTEGASYINIEAGTSNFTDVMGLTQTERDENGNIVSSKMYTEAQELGQNAMLTVNGTSITSTSNTITSDISRIEGVTINLKRASTEEDGITKLDVTQNTTDLVDAVKSFVNAYNDTLAKVEEVTAQGADLHGETSLTSLTRTLRSYATSSNDSNGGAFRLLSQLGISVSAADGSNISTANTSKLEFNEDVFLKALEEDPASVQAMLAGDNGAFNMMENTVEMSLKASVGFFDVKQTSLDNDIKKSEEKITKQNSKIEVYRKQLEDKFSNMELMIAQMQQNYSSFLG